MTPEERAERAIYGLVLQIRSMGMTPEEEWENIDTAIVNSKTDLVRQIRILTQQRDQAYEECARIAEEWDSQGKCQDIAAAIRAKAQEGE